MRKTLVAIVDSDYRVKLYYRARLVQVVGLAEVARWALDHGYRKVELLKNVEARDE